eukprot:scaffold24636_cov31-Tisochrysis_lutea.AAC.9
MPSCLQSTLACRRLSASEARSGIRRGERSARRHEILISSRCSVARSSRRAPTTSSSAGGGKAPSCAERVVAESAPSIARSSAAASSRCAL